MADRTYLKGDMGIKNSINNEYAPNKKIIKKNNSNVSF
jgi:hypothetical protein